MGKDYVTTLTNVANSSPHEGNDAPEFQREVLTEVRRLRGLDLSQYRQSTLSRRLSDRMARLGCSHPDDYLRLLRSEAGEVDHLIDTIAINVSAFFRDPMVFHILGERILPQLLHRAQDGQRKSGLRIWSAGCAAGEEPYSIAILLRELQKDRKLPADSLIFTTDIDRSALARAEKALYRREQLQDVRLGILEKYFKPDGDRYRLAPEIRAMVRFSHHDLTSEVTPHPPESVFGHFDLVLCRNLLIYFSDQLQRRVLAKLCEGLVSGGVLVLGRSEELTENVREQFVAEDRGCRIFRKR